MSCHILYQGLYTTCITTCIFFTYDLNCVHNLDWLVLLEGLITLD